MTTYVVRRVRVDADEIEANSEVEAARTFLALNPDVDELLYVREGNMQNRDWFDLAQDLEHSDQFDPNSREDWDFDPWTCPRCKTDKNTNPQYEGCLSCGWKPTY